MATAGTDTIDKTTPQERSLLVGYCESHKQWYKFTDGAGKRVCPECGSGFSNKIGYQLTSQRTFNPLAKKLTKAQMKKLGGQ